MILCTQIACVDENQHERPNEFIPERWLRQDKTDLESQVNNDGKYYNSNEIFLNKQQF